MKQKCLFAITNALLVAIVGALVGLFCKDMFTTGVGTTAFVVLLVTLCIPTLIYLFVPKDNFAVLVLSVLLVVAELGVSIGFMVKYQSEAKVFAIVEACVVGAFLVAMLITIASAGKKEE